MDAFGLLQTALLLQLLNSMCRSPINVSDLKNIKIFLRSVMKIYFLPLQNEEMLRVFFERYCDGTFISDASV